MRGKNHPLMITILYILVLSVMACAYLYHKLFVERVGDELFCGTCGYALTGLASDRCPECGNAITETNTAQGQTRLPRRYLRHAVLFFILYAASICILALITL